MIESWFPTLVYTETLSEHDNAKIADYCRDIRKNTASAHNWRCNTYSSLSSSYNLATDEYFNSLIKDIAVQVGTFCKVYSLNEFDVLLKEAWFNISDPGSYQEYHIHTESHFSAVYYVKTPEGSGDICFRSHEANFDMFPLKHKEQNQFTYKTVNYKAKESNLLIFRSHLSHMVEMNNSNEDRISISMNFIIR